MKMNEILLSGRAQKLLTWIQSFDKILRILILVPVAALVVTDSMYGLLERAMLIRGFAIIGIALLAGGIIDFFYVYHVEERQPPTRKVSKCCYGALIVAAATTVLVCTGLYTVVTSILTEHSALQTALGAYESSAELRLGEPVAINAIKFTPILSNDVNTTALRLFYELKEFHRLLWLMSCLLFAIAHAAVTALNVVLIELSHKSSLRGWNVIPINRTSKR